VAFTGSQTERYDCNQGQKFLHRISNIHCNVEEWKIGRMEVGRNGGTRSKGLLAAIDLESCGPSQPRYAMRPLSAAGSEIRSTVTHLALPTSILPIFHSCTLPLLPLARPVVEQIELGFLFLLPARSLMQYLRLRKPRLSLGIELRGFQVLQNLFCAIYDLSW
jgi:hypothetical protein